VRAEPGLLGRIRSGLPGIVWPPIPVGRSATLVVLARQLAASQWLPAAELEARQYHQLAVLAAHAKAHSPQFAARLRSAGLAPGDLATPEGLRRLPVLARRDVQRAGADLHCRVLPDRHGPVVETRSSGSTGEPVVVRRTALCQLFWRAINLRAHEWFGRDLRRPSSMIGVDHPRPMVQESWAPPLDRLFETGPIQAIPSAMDAGDQVALLREFRPECLTVYPSVLDAILHHCRRHRLDLPGLDRILTVGETLSPRRRAAAEAFFGARIFDSYTCEEMGNIALECPHGGLYHVMAETHLVEVLDAAGAPCRPGEAGRVVVTDLINFATPLVRYDLGDYAERGGPCACGRGLPSLARIMGRERNLLRRPDGRGTWPYLDAELYRDVAPILQQQLVQREPELIEMRLVAETPLTSAQEGRLQALVREALGYPFEVRFSYFETAVPRGPRGKFEDFISLLPAEAD
jgi:phenylacetate-CoA ligase